MAHSGNNPFRPATPVPQTQYEVVVGGGVPQTYQDLRTFRVPAGFRGRSLVVVALWRIVQGSLFAWSPSPLHGWRCLLLRLFGARIGKGVRILPTARVSYPWKLKIGEHAWIGCGAVLYNLAPISIGAHAVISQRSYLCAAGHALDAADFPYDAAPIVVSEQAWIAMDAMIAPGVTVGRGAVLGARSSAFHDIAPGVIAIGSPARMHRLRPRSAHPSKSDPPRASDLAGVPPSPGFPSPALSGRSTS